MKHAIITGGSRGIGLAIAGQLASAGYNLFLVAKNADRLAAAAAQLRAKYPIAVVPYACDLSQQEAGRSIAHEIRAHQIIPDALVLNAGIYLEGNLSKQHLWNAPFAAFEETLQVNLFAAFHCVQALVEDLRKGNGKRIIIIGSTADHEAYPAGALYSVAKWGLRGFAVNLRQELKEMSIGVTLISPGDTLTDFWAGADLPPDRLLDPLDIGRIVKMCMELSHQAVVEEIVVRPMLGDLNT